MHYSLLFFVFIFSEEASFTSLSDIYYISVTLRQIETATNPIHCKFLPRFFYAFLCHRIYADTSYTSPLIDLIGQQLYITLKNNIQPQAVFSMIFTRTHTI